MRMTLLTKGKNKGHIQTAEYVPRGPVRIAKLEKPTAPIVKLDVPLTPHQPQRVKDRVSGRLYDGCSGALLGLASDEMKATHTAGRIYTRVIGGMVQLFVIHP